jgi:cytochrome c556
MHSRKLAATLVAGLAFVAIAAVAVAQDVTVDPAISALSPAEMVLKREELMKSNGGTLRSAGNLSGAEAVAAADTLIYNFSNLTVLFGESTKGIESKALPAVWDNAEGFNAIMLKALDAANAMKTAAEAGDAAAYATANKSLGAACGECHQGFRS